MKSRARWIGFGMAGLLAGASAAQAAPMVTLSVPVQLARLDPTIRNFHLRCRLAGTDPTTGSYGPLGPDLLTPWTPLVGGAYSGTVTVVFDSAVYTATMLSGGANYGCGLEFQMADGSTHAIYVSPAPTVGPFAHDPRAPFTPMFQNVPLH